MIDYHRFCQIKDLHEHQGLNASQIAEALALDPRTVSDGWPRNTSGLPHATAATQQTRSIQSARLSACWRAIPIRPRAGLPAPA